MKNESKQWQRLEGKIRNLKQYLQVMDLSLTISNTQANKQKNNGKTIAETLGASLDTHGQLNPPNLQRDITRTFVSARKMLNEQAFVELHCLFSDYLANVITEIAHIDPKKLLGTLGTDDDRSIKFAELVTLGNYNSILNEMASRVFRKLENLRSSKEMLEQLCKITKIEINDQLKDEALLYIDVRHLIIHNDSVADENFKNRNSTGLVPLNKNKICLKYAVTDRAISTIEILCRSIDEALIAKGMLNIRKQK